MLTFFKYVKGISFSFLGYLKNVHKTDNKVILVHVTDHLHNFAYNSKYILTCNIISICFGRMAYLKFKRKMTQIKKFNLRFICSILSIALYNIINYVVEGYQGLLHHVDTQYKSTSYSILSNIKVHKLFIGYQQCVVC